MKTRWRMIDTDLVERENDYTATFVLLNVDTDAKVTVALTTKRGGPASDLVGACRATAVALVRAAEADDASAEIEHIH